MVVPILSRERLLGTGMAKNDVAIVGEELLPLGVGMHNFIGMPGRNRLTE